MSLLQASAAGGRACGARVRRLTDQSTNGDCTRSGGRNAAQFRAASEPLGAPTRRYRGRSDERLRASVRRGAAPSRRAASLRLGACGGGGDNPSRSGSKKETAKQTVLGFPGARDQEHDPGRRRGRGRGCRRGRERRLSRRSRRPAPQAVTLVDQERLARGIAASALMAPPASRADPARPTGRRPRRDLGGARARCSRPGAALAGGAQAFGSATAPLPAACARPRSRQATRSRSPPRSTSSPPSAAGSLRRTS